MFEARQGHRGGVFWMTGLSGAGKSTLAHATEKELFAKGFNIRVLDGDIIRHGLCSDLSFSVEDRCENIRRIAQVSLLMVQQGIICLCAFITPLQQHREISRKIIGNDYYEIFVSCPLEECERRDIKGFYKLAREGKIKEYTGISSPYDTPLCADLTIETVIKEESICVKNLCSYIIKQTDINK